MEVRMKQFIFRYENVKKIPHLSKFSDLFTFCEKGL